VGQEDPEPRPLPAVALLNLKLLRVDGLEVLRRIWAQPHTWILPVVEAVRHLGLYWLLLNITPPSRAEP
jgi:CheY-like chemotaxis protein